MSEWRSVATAGDLVMQCIENQWTGEWIALVKARYAPLFAAAPDILAALKGMLAFAKERHEFEMGPGSWQPEDYPEAAAALLALAKARGE